MKLHNYQVANSKIWQGRSSATKMDYFHEHVQCFDLNLVPQDTKHDAFVLIGFCCDAGVKRNQGRIGAKAGPDAIRKCLAGKAWHLGETHIYDLGNIICDNDELELAQQDLAAVIEFALSNNLKPIVLGGGHETAWGHFQGLQQAGQTQNLGIINFDAHFDLRELANGKGHSGSPFLQISKACQDHNQPFNYCVLGIQEQANINSLFATAKNLNVKYQLLENINDFDNTNKLIKNFIDSVDNIYLTFCLDVLSHAIAPGVSAPQAYGLFLEQVVPLLKFILQQKKLLSFDIVELAPNYDQNNATARVAAHIVYLVLKLLG